MGRWPHPCVATKTQMWLVLRNQCGGKMSVAVCGLRFSDEKTSSSEQQRTTMLGYARIGAFHMVFQDGAFDRCTRWHLFPAQATSPVCLANYCSKRSAIATLQVPKSMRYHCL